MALSLSFSGTSLHIPDCFQRKISTAAETCMRSQINLVFARKKITAIETHIRALTSRTFGSVAADAMNGDRDGGEAEGENKTKKKGRGPALKGSSAGSSKRSKVLQNRVIKEPNVAQSNRAYDICFSEGDRSVAVPERHASKRNNESQNQMGQGVERASSRKVLRPGMVLLKNYTTLQEQVEMVKICRNLGVAPGGFHQPRLKFGATINRQIMCLGLNWDAQKYRYDAIRSFDGTEAPPIPPCFRALVQKALLDSHELIKECNVTEAEDVLPPITPNACIVGFYPAATGKLGLHQDNTESKESLSKGLSVVSFSVGDSAEFFYGDERKMSTTQKVLLESGDLLVFGGRSRLVFHGVSRVIPNTAPRELLEETGLRPGRLNLTFREA